MSDIVEDIINIMDGPSPPRNAKKRDNAMQSFLAEHQQLYEILAKSSGDRMQEIQKYRNTHPKLTEVIRKKRSLVNQEVPGLVQSNKTTYDYNCSACRKLRKFKKLQAMSLHNKCQIENKKSINGVRKNSRDLLRKKSFGRKPILTKSNTCKFKNISIGTVSNASMYLKAKRHMSKLAGNEKVLNVDAKTQNSVVLSQRSVNTSAGDLNHLRTPDHSSHGSLISIKRNVDTDSCEPSISSYNSYGSMEQEPMD